MDNEVTAILFVHGIQGSPAQFQWMINQLPPRIHYENVLLAGHGGNVEAFRHARKKEWQDQVNDTAIKLCRQYRRVCYVGHSMGCLLGMEAAKQSGVHFSSMLLLACPLSLRPTFAYFRNNLLAVLNYHGGNPYILSVKNANSVFAKHAWEYLSCLHPYLELLRLIRDTRKAPQKPINHVTAFFFEKDEIVGKKASRLAKQQFGFTTVQLPQCGHDYWTTSAKEQMMACLIDALQ